MVRQRDATSRARAILDAEGDLRWAYLFGSCARHDEGRDVDIAIMSSTGACESAVAWGSLIAQLETAVAAPVDLVDLRHTPLPLLASILHDGIVLLDRDRESRHRWEADTLSRWIDFRPAWDRYERIRTEALSHRVGGVG